MTSTGQEAAWTAEALTSPHTASDKAGRVRRMFNAIAPTYERVNTVCSGGRDAAWRRRAISLAKVSASDRVLDIACGTGDFARAFKVAGAADVIGCDFAREMLQRAASRSQPGLHWCEADALALPFRDACFDLVSCAFGVRNFADLDRGLAEMCRVLRPNGRAVILEFSRPTIAPIRWTYEFYAHQIMPTIACWLSADRQGAYRYLPRSIVTFPSAEEMSARLRRAGFAHVDARPLTMGIVTVYTANREPPEPAERTQPSE
jgi:demethylmenaquinone methyltransferase / 2-methoxy-6-polyprenyl-1,4-benzoquinol methylase